MKIRRWFPAAVYWLFLAGWAGLISWLSSRGADQIPTLFGMVWDKLLHSVAFGLLTLLFLLAVHQGFRYPARPALLAAAFLVSLLYGLVDEWHQSMVATRVASAADLLADGVGSLIALPMYIFMARARGRAGKVKETGDG